MASNTVENQVECFVQLLKTVQSDLMHLNLEPKKAIEIWSIGARVYRDYVAGTSDSIITIAPGVTIKKSDFFQGGNNETRRR